MRKVVLTILALSMLVLAVVGCAGDKNTIKTELGKSFAIAIGQNAVIKSENLKVEFLDVTEDSRCPSDVVCIQAGRAVCQIEITLNGATSTATLMQIAGGTGETQKVGGYSYKFSVLPYPVSTHQIQKAEYSLNLTVTKP